jgi:hypothetical protein
MPGTATGTARAAAIVPAASRASITRMATGPVARTTDRDQVQPISVRAIAATERATISTRKADPRVDRPEEAPISKRRRSEIRGSKWLV